MCSNGIHNILIIYGDFPFSKINYEIFPNNYSPKHSFILRCAMFSKIKTENSFQLEWSVYEDKMKNYYNDNN